MELNNIISGYFTLLKNAGSIMPEKAGAFIPGQIMLAKVVAKEGETYFLQSGNQRFSGLSKSQLTVGQELELFVASNKEGIVWLKIVTPDSEMKSTNTKEKPQNEMAEARNQAIRYGVVNEKELGEISTLRQGIPVDESTAVRYLLDPHLLTAVLLPEMPPHKNKGSIEVTQYKNSAIRQNVWEITMELNMESLGLVEVKIRLADNKIFVQIWAEQMQTETIIRQNKNELEDAHLKIEIIPVNQGPLIYREKENIDYRV